MAKKKEVVTEEVILDEKVEWEEGILKRKNAFKEALKSINAEWKKGSKTEDDLINLTAEMNADVEKIPTGSLILDNIIGGGIPKGRIIEIYGKEGSGKTSIALTVASYIQKQGGNVAFIDVEQAFDPRYATKLGVNVDELAFSQPAVAEDALGLVFKLAESGTTDLIVIDSVAALTPRDEYEEDVDKVTVGLLARLMSKALRKLISIASKNNCTIIFLNQTRDNIQTFGFAAEKSTTPGGKALKFYASQRIQVNKIGTVKEADEIIGTKVKLKCIKNKVARPYGEGETVLTFDRGINREGELLNLAESFGVIKKKGFSYYFNTEDNMETYEYFDDLGYKVGLYVKGILENLAKDKNLYNLVAKYTLEKLSLQNENVAE